MWRSTAFASIFFTCLVAPYFAILTFAPQVFSSLGFNDPKVSIIAANAVAFLGALAGMLVIECVGRRRLLLASFWVMVVTMGVIGAWGSAPAVCGVGLAVTYLWAPETTDLTLTESESATPPGGGSNDAHS
jgi:putative MFS transporter